MKDAGGVSLADALRAIGFDPRAVPTARWKPAEWAAFLELHIEQDPVLEDKGLPVGVVTGRSPEGAWIFSGSRPAQLMRVRLLEP